MKVIWITSAYPWSGNLYGGIFFQTQAQALSRLGVKTVVEVAIPWIPSLAALISSRYAHQRSAPRRQIEGDLEIHRIPYFGHRFQMYLGRPHLSLARRILKNLPFHPDLIHGHYAYPMGLAAVEVARSLGIPSVITLHGSDVNFFAAGSRLGARRFRSAVSGADRVICVSRALEDRTHQIAGLSAQYLPIGIDLRKFSPTLTRSQARTVLELPPDKHMVLYIGNLLASKGISIALEALGHPSLEDAVGVFVGSGPLAPTISSQRNCLWREEVPNSMIVTYLTAADVIILPSYAEGLPTVMVEAGACGTPVIATRVGGIPELLADNRGTLVAPGSAGELREAILEALARPEEARCRAGRLREHVQGSFDVDKNTQQLVNIYQDLLLEGDPKGK